MPVVEYIDLDDDEIYVKVDHVDLISEEEDIVKEDGIGGEDDNIEEVDSVARSEIIAEGAAVSSVTEQGTTAMMCLSVPEQEQGATMSSLMVDMPIQPENQGLLVASDVAKEAMQSGNCELIASSDCAGEALQIEYVGKAVVSSSMTKQGDTPSLSTTEEAMQSEYQEFLVTGDPGSATGSTGICNFGGYEEPEGDNGRDKDSADQSEFFEDAAKAALSSSISEQGGTVKTSLSMAEQEQGITTSLSPTKTKVTEQVGHETAALLSPPPISTALLFPRQFWKAGDEKFAAQTTMNICLDGQNRLRIHPKFLHSNATSHKWAFGAIAELLDNAVDEVPNGATFVKIDKMKYPSLGEYSLLVQDDGGGMSPEDIRHCMSFGFSNKCTDSSIGQYGNGFKTSTMRLGADAMVFSSRQDNRLTRSVGLLSYTFLARNSCSDILVPVVDYEFNLSSCTFKRIMDHGEKHFSSNLYTLLKWSPFSTEDDLLNQPKGRIYITRELQYKYGNLDQYTGTNFKFEDIGCHGTKIVIFNLWFNDAQEMELDFTTDDEDIMISGAPKIPEESNKVARLNHMHIANRFQYSLRVYASILYLRLPKHFKVILCGRVVEPHHIVNDLRYRECIQYRPNIGVSTEVSWRWFSTSHDSSQLQANVITTIGFLEGAPKLNIYGFNVYHKNRLILPFWPAGSERAHGRGIAGVLEANFIRPTHDKQDFEKTSLFHRLETRLKDMRLEYWRTHYGYLVSYTGGATTKNIAGSSRTEASVVNGGNTLNLVHFGIPMDQMDRGACSSTRREMRISTPRKTPQLTEPYKRRNSRSVIEWRAQKRRNTNDYDNQPGNIEMGDDSSRTVISQNQKLKAGCSELEAGVKQLQFKADILRNELNKWQKTRADLTKELEFYRGLHGLLT